MGFIRHLRSKPEATRRRLLYVSTITLFSLILLFWLVSLPYQLADVSASESASRSESYSPFVVVVEEIGGLWGDFTRGLQVVREDIFGG